jgi:hypothetical protein
MNTVSIDFASHDGHIACIDGDAVRAIRIIGRTNETELIPLLEEVLKEAGWAKADIERIACNLGPGGFTSVRNGVAFANALADGLGVLLGGYHGSALALARCHGSAPLTMTTSQHAKMLLLSSRAEPRDDVWWIHSTRRDQAFVRGGSWNEPTLVSLTDLPASLGTVTGDLTDAHRAFLTERGATFPEPKPLEEVLPGFTDALTYEKTSLVPWYGRGI